MEKKEGTDLQRLDRTVDDTEKPKLSWNFRFFKEYPLATLPWHSDVFKSCLATTRSFRKTFRIIHTQIVFTYL